MISALKHASVAVVTVALLVLGVVLDGPDDIDAERDTAADVVQATHTASTQFARDVAACRAYHGPQAQIRLRDGVHLVCSAPRAAGITSTLTAQVQP